MGKDSEILWTEHTFSPWWGCTKISEGCAHCYAETWAKRTGFKIWGQDAERRYFGDKHWSEPAKWNAAAEKLGVMHRVFCGSMCDIFEDRMDMDEHRLRVFRMVHETPSLLWLFLTKRPLKAVQMLPEEWRGCPAGTTSTGWPRNVMIGVTIENQARMDERMQHVELLHMRYPGAQVFASCEPLLSALDWSRPANRGGGVNRDYWLSCFDWVIGGGESGPGARPMHPDWIRKLRDDCENRTDMARPWPVSFMFKQWGESVPESHIISPFGGLRFPVSDGRRFQIDGTPWVRVGKKLSGRILDGRTWDGVPRLTYGPQVPEAL